MQISSAASGYPTNMSSGVSSVQQSSQVNIQSQKADEPEVQQSQQTIKVPVDGKGGNLDIKG